MPDATTLLNFRHLLETHGRCKGLFTAINADLAARGLLSREGTLVDATLIAAPSSTMNAKRERDLEIRGSRGESPLRADRLFRQCQRQFEIQAWRSV